MADVVTEGCVMDAAHRLSILWKQKRDAELTDVFKYLFFLCSFQVSESEMFGCVHTNVSKLIELQMDPSSGLNAPKIITRHILDVGTKYF